MPSGDYWRDIEPSERSERVRKAALGVRLAATRKRIVRLEDQLERDRLLLVELEEEKRLLYAADDHV